MSGSAANTAWARALLDELARAGLREVIVAPGSRSTPLVLAAAADDRLRIRVHLDERSAGFFALGVGKATGRPAAVVTTSGTAVANLLPAVVEAAQAGVPLLVLSADRPPRLRGADANQAIDQVRIFGRYARAFHELAPPSLDGPALRHLRTVAVRAYHASVGSHPGPVHVNCPFDKPLEPAPLPDDFVAQYPLATEGRSGGHAFTRVVTGRPTLSDDALDTLLRGLDPSRAVLVAGPMEAGGGSAAGDAIDAGAESIGAAAGEVRRLAAAMGAPLLADPLSGARFGSEGEACPIAAYDLFLRDSDVRARLSPTLVLRVGAAPTSAALQRWLLDYPGVEQVVVDPGGRWKDHGATATRYASADVADTLGRVRARWAPENRADPAWTALWSGAGAAARTALEAHRAAVREGAREPHEGEIMAAIVDALPSDATLFVSSSMPVRDLDAFGHPRAERILVLANRGASGIDGVVSSAFGAASQRDAPVVCVLGDIAFFHDRNGLLWSREPDARVIFVVIDNDGGGIFHMLPIAEHEPDFTRYFATPHGIDPKHAAAAHGIDYRRLETDAVGEAVGEAISAGRTAVLHVCTDRERNHALRAEAESAVGRSVREALG